MNKVRLYINTRLVSSVSGCRLSSIAVCSVLGWIVSGRSTVCAMLCGNRWRTSQLTSQQSGVCWTGSASSTSSRRHMSWMRGRLGSWSTTSHRHTQNGSRRSSDCCNLSKLMCFAAWAPSISPPADCLSMYTMAGFGLTTTVYIPYSTFQTWHCHSHRLRFIFGHKAAHQPKCQFVMPGILEANFQRQLLLLLTCKRQGVATFHKSLHQRALPAWQASYRQIMQHHDLLHLWQSA